MLRLLLLHNLFAVGLAWTNRQFASTRGPGLQSKTVLEAMLSYNQISRIGFFVEVEKPLGVVFGENDPPFNGLAVLEVNEDGNAAAAGIEVGHQLLSVNRKSVVGDDFDTAMDLLRQGSDPLEVQLYPGTVRQLFTILKNVPDESEDDDFEEEAIVMDENYVSPVVAPEEEEREPITAGEVLGAVKNMGASLFEKGEEAKDGKQGGGLFGMFKQETIQLEGDDASGLN